MKILFFTAALALSFISCASCSKKAAAGAESQGTATQPTGSQMKVKIGNSTFTATLYDNAAAASFRSMLPLTLNMKELNNNEKFADLPRSLPAAAGGGGAIQNGDLMLYGSSTLVLFYKAFSTSYSYTPLGRIEDAVGLQAALGTGSVKVTFELE